MGNGGLYRLCPKSLPLDELVCRWSPEAVCQTWSEGLLDGTSDLGSWSRAVGVGG